MAKLKHVLVIPFPEQGHLAPLMKLSHLIAGSGIKVTFVNSDSVHAKLIAANPELGARGNRLSFASIPDGFKTADDQRDPQKPSILRIMQDHLRDLIREENEQLNGSEHEQISCVIADLTAGWALEVAKRMGIRSIGFWPASASTLALLLHTPKLVEGGVIDTDGIAIRYDVITISENIPPYKTSDFIWNMPENLAAQKRIFGYLTSIVQHVDHADLILCNTFRELEVSTIAGIIPGILPIGPLTAHDQSVHCIGSLWSEDLTCSDWLNQQLPGSVIYVAFGSSTILSPQKFCKLAEGLEEMGRPFLWVVRPDLTDGSVNDFHEGFLQRIGNNGKVVQWAPQEQVLAHPSIGCFFTHCGWNSTLEGLRNGVPLLCLPYCADQYLNRTHICDVWRVGLAVDVDGNGVISKHEVRTKVEKIVSSDEIKANCQRMKDMARKSVSAGGSSLINIEGFIAQVKA